MQGDHDYRYTFLHKVPFLPNVPVTAPVVALCVEEVITFFSPTPSLVGKLTRRLEFLVTSLGSTAVDNVVVDVVFCRRALLHGVLV